MLDLGDVAQVVTSFLRAIEARETLPADYKAFVDNYVFAPEGDRIAFPEARAAVVRLSERVFAFVV